MRPKYADTPCRVHVMTRLAREIRELSSSIKSVKTVAKIVGCDPSYVNQVRHHAKSRAHIYFDRETMEAMR